MELRKFNSFIESICYLKRTWRRRELLKEYFARFGEPVLWTELRKTLRISDYEYSVYGDNITILRLKQ